MSRFNSDKCVACGRSAGMPNNHHCKPKAKRLTKLTIDSIARRLSNGLIILSKNGK